MAYYYSASERAFFSSDLVSTGAMPADKVAVTDEAYRQLMADQVAGKLIRPGAGNAPESANQSLTEATRFGDISMGKLTATELDLNGNADISGTLKVTGASTLGAVNAGNVAASGTLTVTGNSTLNGTLTVAKATTVNSTLKVTGLSTLADVNAVNVSASGTLGVTGTSTFTGKLTANGGIATKALSATSITNSGAMTNTGNLTVNGSTTVKKLTATELDLNGNADVSGTFTAHGKSTLEGVSAGDIDAKTLDTTGNVSVGGLLAVTGDTTVNGSVAGKGTAQFATNLAIQRADVTRGTVPDANKFSALYFTDKNGNPNSVAINNCLGFIESGVRSNGGTDIKMVALRNAAGNNGYDAFCTVGYFDYGGDEFEPATRVTTAPASANGTEAVNIIWGNAHYLRTDGSNALTADSLKWRNSQDSGNFTWAFRVNDAASTESTSSCQDSLIIAGLNQATVIASGETCGSTSKIATVLGLLENMEDVGICANANLTILTGVPNTPDENTYHKHVFRSNGNVELGGHLILDADSMSQGLLLRSSALKKGTAPSANQWCDIAFCEDGGTGSSNRLGAVTMVARTDGSTAAYLYSYKNEVGSTYATLGVGYNADGTVFTVAPTPPTGDRSTKIATTAFLENDGVIARKELTSIQSVAGCFWFDSSSGIDKASNDLDWTGNSDWVGLQVGMKNGADKSQFLFNGPNFYMRSTDAALGSESWSDWVQIADRDWVLSQLSSSIPAGAVMYFAQKSVPSGWLLCNGANVSRTQYPNLFKAIGTTYGAGNGSSTFTLPNLKDKFIEGTVDTSQVGQSVAAGLPNITGTTGVDNDNMWAISGVFTNANQGGDGPGGGGGANKVNFDASVGSSIYGASATVQPPALRMLPCIKT